MVGEKQKMILVATCLFGLERQLGEEIDALGCMRLDTMDGRVTFEGTEADIARANIRLRLAERVFIRVGQFPARSFTELAHDHQAHKRQCCQAFLGPVLHN